MIKLNRHSLLFFSLALFLGFLTSGIFQKILPVLLQHTVYYCQQAFSAFSVKLPSFSGVFMYSILAGGALAVAGKVYLHFISIQQLRKQLVIRTSRNKILHSILKKLQLERKTLVILDRKPVSFCLGIRNPKIYISTGALRVMDHNELEAILLHEKYHLENRDSFTMFLASVIQFVFPFFPLFKDLLTNYRIEREINADQNAVEILGDNVPLLNVLKKMLAAPQTTMIGVSAVAEYDSLEPRILVLTKKNLKRRKFKMFNLIISFFSISILSAILLTPVQAVEMQSMNQKTTMVCLSGDACTKWCKEHNTVFPYSSQKDVINTSNLYTPSQ